MAKDKNEKAAAAVATNGSDFDFSKYMPEGYSADDLRIIGGLTPIYAPETVMSEGFPPCVGHLDRIELLPEVKQGTRIYIPMMIRCVVTAATKGILGKKDELQIVDVGVGEDILMPVTGNLRSNKVLLGAVPGCRPHKDLPSVFDTSKVFLAAFRVRGTKDIGQVQEMWDWDCRLHPKTEVRNTFMKGRFALPEGPIAIAQLPSGQLFDAKTGEIIERTAAAS